MAAGLVSYVRTVAKIRLGRFAFGLSAVLLIPGAASAWMPYVLVKDIDAATKKGKNCAQK
jgi:hypothetical protein